jgi:ketosteroid isomerase-like protein
MLAPIWPSAVTNHAWEGKMESNALGSPADNSSIRSEILKINKDRCDAWLQRNADRYLSFYWGDALIFIGQSTTTVEKWRGALKLLFEAGGGAVKFELGSIDYMVFSPEGDAVTTSFSFSQRFRDADDVEGDQRWHETDTWYRHDGTWKLAAIHATYLNN